MIMDNLLSYIINFILMTGTLASYIFIVIKIYLIKGIAWAVSSALIPIPIIPYLAWNNWDSFNAPFLVFTFFLLLWLLVFFKIINLEKGKAS